MGTVETTTEITRGASRRTFIKGIIAAGSAASSVAYLFRGTQGVWAQPARPGAVERLVTLAVNGRQRRVDVMKQETLVMTLRNKLGLTGTKLGCDRAECGNCTVLIDGVPRYACSVLTHSVRHDKITTIEGLASPDGQLHPVQEAFVAELGPQCGFCTPGQIMSTVGLLAVNPRPTRAEAAEALAGNLCRCGAYDHYLNAVMLAVQEGELTMADYKLIGKDFTPPDLIGKVTGAAKYAEDFRVDGMLFAKLLMSPVPHAKVRGIDASKALAMPGVVAVLTADDVPKVRPPHEPILTHEPLYAGEPILAVAAVDETIAAEAIEQISVDLQPLPFVIDPLESLRPRGPNARSEGNVANLRLPLQTVKWTARDFVAAGKGRLPMGKPSDAWQYGNVEAGFARADLILEETFVTQALSHHPMEPRSALAYWQNGKLYLHGSTQSVSFAVPGIARLLGLQPSQLVFIAENCGGGFGSKAAGYPQWGIPALLAKMARRPVMLRVTREEEYCFGRARPGFQGWVKIGFRKDGRITGLDLYIVHSNGPYTGFWDYSNAGDAVSIVYQPMAMRWRGISVLTNTPPRSAQRGPGQTQIAAALKPFLDQAARQLGIDRVAIRRLNAPGPDGKIGAQQEPLTSSYLQEALDKGATRFNWSRKAALSGQRQGAKATGIGVGVAYHSAGRSGFDGLVVLKPDGKLYIHNGPGNLGTFSYAGTARTAAEVLGMPWERCEIVYGDTRKHLPWNLGQFGSNTSFTMTRTNYVAAMDAKRKLQEIAARELGGTADQFDVGNERVYLKSDASQGLSFAEAARHAMQLGGAYSGQELPPDLHPMTALSAKGVAGQGLVGVAKDTLERRGTVPAFCASFVRVEVDLETGQVAILEYLGVADCGTVIHPQSLSTQIKGGAVQGFGLALSEKHIFDPKFGLSGTRALYTSKPPTYLDVPLEMQWDAVDQPDPYSPIGSKGIGEPPVGSAAAAVLGAVSDALGGVYFNRIPVTTDMILNAVEGQPQSYKPLEVNV